MRIFAWVLTLSYMLFADQITNIPFNQDNPNQNTTDLFQACPKIDDFSRDQLKVLYDSYEYGQKEEMGLILASIAWHESCAGKYNINFSDPSAGAFHIYLPNALRFKNIKDTVYNRNLIGQILVNDFDLSKEIALNELKLWRAQYRGNVKKIIKSYNKGNSWRRNKSKDALAEKYYAEVSSKMKILQELIPKIRQEFVKTDVFEAASNMKQKNTKERIILLQEK